MVCTAAMLTAVLPACSNEDEEGGGVASYGKNATSTPPVANAGIEFPVTSIYHNNSLSEAYNYQNGCITGGFERLNNESITITSNPLTVRVTRTNSSYDEVQEYKNIKVNSDGFITSCDYECREDYEDDEDYVENYSVTLAYDGDGHLILERFTYSCSDGETGNGTGTYTWVDGNLTEMDYKEYYEWEGETDEYHYREEMTYEEPTYINSGVWHFCDYQACGYGGLFYDIFLYGGMLGKPSKNIPTTYNEYQYFDEQYNTYTITGVYYNQDNSISQIRSQYSYTGSWSGNGAGMSIVSYGYNQEWNDDWTLDYTNRRIYGQNTNERTRGPKSRLHRKMKKEQFAKQSPRTSLNINNAQK